MDAGAVVDSFQEGVFHGPLISLVLRELVAAGDAEAAGVVAAEHVPPRAKECPPVALLAVVRLRCVDPVLRIEGQFLLRPLGEGQHDALVQRAASGPLDESQGVLVERRTSLLRITGTCCEA